MISLLSMFSSKGVNGAPGRSEARRKTRRWRVGSSLDALEGRALMTGFDPSAALSRATADYGLNVQIPTGLQFYRFTSKTEPTSIQNLNLPLRDNATFYGVDWSSGASASFGNITVGTAAGGTGAVVIEQDSDDTEVFVVAGGGSSLAFGFSTKGLIPFQPIASNYTGRSLTGQLWGSISDIQIPDTPLTASGNIVYNLDINHSGTLYDIKHDASTLFKPGALTSSVLSHVGVGLNGTLSVGIGSEYVGLSVPVGGASFSYIPAHTEVISKSSGARGSSDTPATRDIPTSIQFAGETVNPLAGTPVANLFRDASGLVRYSVQGGTFGRNATELARNLSFSEHLESGSSFRLAGLSLSNRSTMDLEVSTSSITVSATMALPFSNGGVSCFGEIDLTNGSFLIRGDATNFASTPGLNSSAAHFEFAYNVPVSRSNPVTKQVVTTRDTHLTADLRLGLNYSYDGYGVDASVTGKLNYDFTTGMFGGSIDASAGIDYKGRHYGVGADASFSGSGGVYTFRIDVDLSFKTPSIHVGPFTIPGVKINLGHIRKSISI